MTYRAVKLPGLKGKPLLLNFWAPWCGPCLAEFPTFQKLLNQYTGRLQIVALAVQDARANVLSFVQKNPAYTFMFLTDPVMQDRDSPLLKYFGARGLPTSVFVSADGTIVDRWIGFDGETELVQRIRQLMSK